jgi:hypothetical protein
MEIPAPETASCTGAYRLPVRLDLEDGSSDSLAGWLEAYFAVEVTTAQSSRAVQRRDLGRFPGGGGERRPRPLDEPPVAGVSGRAPDGSRRFSDRTIARIAAHLKTFAKWIHTLRPFRLVTPRRNRASAGSPAPSGRSRSPAAGAHR